MSDQKTHHDSALSLPLGPDTLVIEQRYEFLSILNDVLMALWFLAGSICFFFKPLETVALWCFTIGSAQFLLRPMIRLARHLHLRKRGAARSGAVTDF